MFEEVIVVCSFIQFNFNPLRYILYHKYMFFYLMKEASKDVSETTYVQSINLTQSGNACLNIYIYIYIHTLKKFR
jgi:hypothetical protein